jgi:hypothetical protein
MSNDDADIGMNIYIYYTRCGMNDDDEDISRNIHTTQGAA